MRILFSLFIVLTVAACAGRSDDEGGKTPAVSVVPYENFAAYLPRQAEYIALERGTTAFAACDNAVACSVLGLDSSAVSSSDKQSSNKTAKKNTGSVSAKKGSTCGGKAGCGCGGALTAEARKPLPKAYLGCAYAAYQRALNSEYLEERDEITVGKALLDACMIHEGYMPRRLVNVTVPAAAK